MREYKEIGFDGVYLLSGIAETETMFGHAIQISVMADLHRSIIAAICSCAVSLSAQMIYVLRIELDLSQADLGEALGFSDRQMLSLYERGKRVMPITAQQALKRMALANVSGSKSVSEFNRQILVSAPSRFEFEFNGAHWYWCNSPHQHKQFGVSNGYFVFTGE